MRHHLVAEGWILFDHRLDRLGKLSCDLGLRLDRLVGHAATGYFEPAAQRAYAGCRSITEQALLYAKDLVQQGLSLFLARNSSIASA